MGNLNCAGCGKAKKKELSSDLEKTQSDTVDGLEKKLNSLPNNDENEVQAQKPNGSIEPTDASDTVSVFVCSNQQVDQSKQINLGLSPSLNMLKEQIQNNFEEFTDENTLEILGDDNTWTPIAVDNINIPLIDIGIKNNSTISIVNKEKAPPPAALPSDDTTTD